MWARRKSGEPFRAEVNVMPIASWVPGFQHTRPKTQALMGAALIAALLLSACGQGNN